MLGLPTVSDLMQTYYTWRLKCATCTPGEPLARHVACFDCGLSHTLPTDRKHAMASAEDFFARHSGHQCNWLERPGVAGLWHSNADVKQSWQTLQTATVTNLHSLASSVTAGWQGAVVDNTSNLYLDTLLQVVIDFANTAPANSKAVFVYAFGSIESGVYPYPCTGSEGTITLSDITANPSVVKRVGTLPYLVQDAVMQSQAFSVGVAFGGAVPPYWGPVIMNHSGAAFAASANTVKFRGSFLTVV